MSTLIIEGNMDGLGVFIALLFFIGFGIPILLAILGWIFWSRGKKNTAKGIFIVSGIYLIVSLGICGSLMM